MSLARIAVNNNPESDKTLLQLGGTKKRKRDISQSDESEDEPDNNLQTPVPNINRTSNKRKSSENYDDMNPKKFRGNSQQKFKKNFGKSKKGKKGKMNSPKASVAEQQVNNSQENQSNNNPKQKNKFRRRNKNNQQNHDVNVSNEAFETYDYSSVDFNKFQGGASQHKGQRFFKSNFKPRVSKFIYSVRVF